MFNNINTKSITFNLIAINIIVYIASQIFLQLYPLLSLHYIFNTQVITSIDTNKYESVYAFFLKNGYGGAFLPIQLLTHMFMHYGFMHLFSNMFSLFMFGTILEQVWGPRRFLVFYFITGFGAVILHTAVQCYIVYSATGTINPSLDVLNSHPQVLGTYFSTTVGASGAIFGIATAFATLFPNTELMIIPIPIPIKAKYLMPLYILFELVMGVRGGAGDDVAHFAHLGGALFGFILVRIWNRNRTTLY